MGVCKKKIKLEFHGKISRVVRIMKRKFIELKDIMFYRPLDNSVYKSRTGLVVSHLENS